ncbi:unnamed protein product [Didymodactylos carnosus]|uniref:Uncharacterized protein n=1 Tax=Didymodactylos carnosus TaxID=1234261 RepID=A0A813R4J0_9BILA|nr:unnamed protein product [Didymodactylos carnosus]CAF1558462.1 unnamed protein product [Didymodactylos carnosus]CAF3558329.1 unnamed protein product [Didymodactylos carnosus]CAF4349726.1 unnamed protein product [Didymodactylos carnosus]
MGNICPWCKNHDEEPTERTPLLIPNQTQTSLSNENSVTSVQPENTPPEPNPFTEMTTIVENMFPKLIDVIEWERNPPNVQPVLADENGDYSSTRQNSEHNTKLIKALQTLIQKKNYNLVNSTPNSNNTSYTSLSSSSSAILPDCGSTTLVSVLSAKPVSQELCHYVSTMAEDFNRVIIEEIKIVHKEDLVVNFE